MMSGGDGPLGSHALVAHSLTAVAGSFITGSYDRTCKVWNTNTGEELLTLEVGAMQCATRYTICNATVGRAHCAEERRSC
jgi:WD40 repeat protein